MGFFDKKKPDEKKMEDKKPSSAPKAKPSTSSSSGQQSMLPTQLHRDIPKTQTSTPSAVLNGAHTQLKRDMSKMKTTPSAASSQSKKDMPNTSKPTKSPPAPSAASTQLKGDQSKPSTSSSKPSKPASAPRPSESPKDTEAFDITSLKTTSNVPTKKSIYVKPDDVKMASRQANFHSLPPAEKKKQDTWARERLVDLGRCGAGFQWVRVDHGYRCFAGGHYISDIVIAKGQPAGYLIVPSADGGGRGLLGGISIDHGNWFIGPLYDPEDYIQRARAKPSFGGRPVRNGGGTESDVIPENTRHGGPGGAPPTPSMLKLRDPKTGREQTYEEAGIKFPYGKKCPPHYPSDMDSGNMRRPFGRPNFPGSPGCALTSNIMGGMYPPGGFGGGPGGGFGGRGR